MFDRLDRVDIMKTRPLALVTPLATLLFIVALSQRAVTRTMADGAPAISAPGSPITSPITFTHGIASGDVTDSSVTLWTRIDQTASITVQVATDSAFTNLAFQQVITPDAATDFTGKVLAGPIDANQEYYYRWLGPGAASPTGTCQTAPAPGTTVNLRLAFSGDSDGTRVSGQPYHNHFEVLDAARQEDLDFFIYLGDMIYSDSSLRPSPAATLAEYREVWLGNRTIQALPDLLAVTSTYAVWDDHEVRNDFAGRTVDPTLYANGRQAMLEYMPIWDAGLHDDPTCAGAPFFRVYSWGDTADIIVLDQRSCRDSDVVQTCYLVPGVLPDPAPTLPAQLRVQLGLLPDPPVGCLDAINDPDRTFLGPVQKQLFKNALMSSTARYKIVVSEVPMQQIFFLPYDRWEGYAAERREILNFLRDNAVENVIFLAADTHANLINQVFVDAFDDPRPLAWEFVAGPIATTTLGETIRDLLGQSGLDAAHDMLDAVGMECRHLDAYSYGLVEVETASDEVTVSLKDETGAVLLDQIHPDVGCQVTLRPPSFSYLPAVFAAP